MTEDINTPFRTETIDKKHFTELKRKIKEKWSTYYKSEIRPKVFGAEGIFEVNTSKNEITFIDIPTTISYILATEYVKNLQNVIFTEKEQKRTVFADSDLTDPAWNNIKSNKKIAKELNKYFKELNIERVGINKDFDDIKKKAFKHMTLLFTPYVRSYMVKDSEITKIRKYIEILPDSDSDKISITGEDLEYMCVEEKIIPLVMNFTYGENTKCKAVIGKYFYDRNLIIIFVNPFSLIEVSTKSKLKDFKFLTEFLKDLKTLITEANIKKTDPSKLEQKIIIGTFKQGITSTLRKKEEEIDHINKRVDVLQQDITSNIKSKSSAIFLMEALQTKLGTFGEKFFQSIEDAKKLPFIEKIDLKDEKVIMYFKPHTQTFDFQFEVDGKLKKFGKRTILVGGMQFLISYDNIKILNTEPMQKTNSSGNLISNWHQHMHINGAGLQPKDIASPCFGDGEASTIINELLFANEFKRLAMMLYSWQQTWEPSMGLSRNIDWVNDRLRKGLPIWDEKMKPIFANEKKRLDSGEQRKLKKDKDYEKNIKKWKNFQATSK